MYTVKKNTGQVTQLSLLSTLADRHDNADGFIIATWNVNSIRAHQLQVIDWLRHARPHILCLQETRVSDDLFPTTAFEHEGYQVHCHGQKGHNGVAIVARVPVSDLERGLSSSDADEQPRLISCRWNQLHIVCIYAPSSQINNHDSLFYKSQWYESFTNHLSQRFSEKNEVVLCGDFNVAPIDSDVFDANSWLCKPYIHQASRDAFQRIIELGYCDVLGSGKLSDQPFTWWDHGDGFQANRGMRLDHFLISRAASGKVLAVNIEKCVRAAANSSDHVPVVLTISSTQE